MATSFDVVEDLGLAQIDDYTLNKLYNNDFAKFQTFCDGLLVNAIPLLTKCRQSLTYNLDSREFDSDLTNEEIAILADFWAIQWFERKVNNSAQFQAKLQNSGSFKNHSEAQNLKEKTSWLDRLRERVYQRITDYQVGNLANIDF